MPVSLILAALGLGLGTLDLTGLLHLPQGMGIAALALGALLLILVVRVVATIVRIVAGAAVLALAAAAIFGPGVFHHLP